MCDDARPVSLRVAHITKTLNITTRPRAAAALASARARSLVRTMAVAIAADAASMVRARWSCTHAHQRHAHARCYARHVTPGYSHYDIVKITHARVRSSGDGGGARSLNLACDGGCDRGRWRMDGACAVMAHTRASATQTCVVMRAPCHSGSLTSRYR